MPQPSAHRKTVERRALKQLSGQHKNNDHLHYPAITDHALGVELKDRLQIEVHPSPTLMCGVSNFLRPWAGIGIRGNGAARRADRTTSPQVHILEPLGSASAGEGTLLRKRRPQAILDTPDAPVARPGITERVEKFSAAIHYCINKRCSHLIELNYFVNNSQMLVGGQNRRLEPLNTFASNNSSYKSPHSLR